MNKRRLSVILIASMVINMNLPNITIFTNENNKSGDTSQPKN